MKDKDKLNKLLEIIGELLKVEGNEWLIDGLLQKIEETSPVEKIAGHPLIQKIYEYCIEEKLSKQANEFYKDFKIDEIKSQLIADYKKMEHERRRDDFENFALCLYQQVENITNNLFKKRIENNWDNEKNKTAISFGNGNKKTVNDIVWGNADNWYANVKLKAVLYFFYFNKEIKSLIPFRALESVFNELYQVRNKNHRGSQATDFQQGILDSIKGNESKYYFKFYGFLEDFVTKVNLNLSGTKKYSISNKQSDSKKKKQSGSLDEKSLSALEQLKKKMDK